MKKKIIIFLSIAIFLTLSGCAKKHEHEWGEWVITKEATIKEAGSRERKCNTCDEIETEEIPIIETEKVELTSDNFHDYFEWCVFTDWDIDEFDDPKKNSLMVFYGYKLKDSYAAKYARSGDAAIKISVIETPYSVIIDESDWSHYTISHRIADHDTSNDEFVLNMSGRMNPDTKEIKWGFFAAGSSGWLSENETFAWLVEEQDFEIEKVKGSILFLK